MSAIAYSDRGWFISELVAAHSRLSSLDSRTGPLTETQIKECWEIYQTIRYDSETKVLGKLPEVMTQEICENFGIAYGLDDSPLLQHMNNLQISKQQYTACWKNDSDAIQRGRSSDIGAAFPRSLSRNSSSSSSVGSPISAPSGHRMRRYSSSGAGGVLASNKWTLLLNMLFLIATAHKVADSPCYDAHTTISVAFSKEFALKNLHQEFMSRVWNTAENETSVTGLELLGLSDLLGYRLTIYKSSNPARGCLALQFHIHDATKAQTATLDDFIDVYHKYRMNKTLVIEQIHKIILQADSHIYHTPSPSPVIPSMPAPAPWNTLPQSTTESPPLNR